MHWRGPYGEFRVVVRRLLQGRAGVAAGAVRAFRVGHGWRVWRQGDAGRVRKLVDVCAKVRSLHRPSANRGALLEATRLHDRKINFYGLVKKPGAFPQHVRQMVNNARGVGHALVVFVFIDKAVPELVVDNLKG